MEKLLEIRVGEGHVQSGLLPLDAAELMESLLAALTEAGADPELLRTANPHIQIVGENSTRAALFTNHASQLRKPVARFRQNAKSYRLGPKGSKFVDQATHAATAWGYVDLIEPAKRRTEKTAKVLRFDAGYRDRWEEKSKALLISGNDEIYARVIRAGGETPTVKLELSNGDSDTYRVKTRALAKKLGTKLYETVKLTADVKWDRKSLKVVELVVTGIAEGWQDRHLGDVLEAHGGTLPIKADFASVEELVLARRDTRSE